MKSIEELWREYVDGHKQEFDKYTWGMIRGIRKAFFAGFNRCYNIANDLESGEACFYSAQYEKEMDDHSEEEET